MDNSTADTDTQAYRHPQTQTQTETQTHTQTQTDTNRNKHPQKVYQSYSWDDLCLSGAGVHCIAAADTATRWLETARAAVVGGDADAACSVAVVCVVQRVERHLSICAFCACMCVCARA